MFNNLISSFFNERFGWRNKESVASTSSTQDAAKEEKQDSQFEMEIAAIMQYYGIKKGEKQYVTTSLSEIEGVVPRQRRRADAYSKILREINTRTGATIMIVNNRKSNK